MRANEFVVGIVIKVMNDRKIGEAASDPYLKVMRCCSERLKRHVCHDGDRSADNNIVAMVGVNE